MLANVVTALLLIIGLINFVPIIGVSSKDRLRALYGVQVDSENLLILMQHRALLFGVIGIFLMYAAFQPALQVAAFAMGLASMLGFIIIACQVGNLNEELKRAVVIDSIALLSLLIALTLFIIDYWLANVE